MGLNERLRPPVGKEAGKLQRRATFEPFTEPDNNPNNLFINGYSGNYAQSMELDRKRIEMVLKIAHLNGKVFLSSMPKSRNRSLAGVNKDGSVEVEKTLIFEDETQGKDEENPLYRTVPIAEGWRVEINDEMMIETLQEKKLAGKKLQGKFVQGFNGIFTTAVFECIRREKLSSVKDKYFEGKRGQLFLNTSLQGLGAVLTISTGNEPLQISIRAGVFWLLVNVAINIYFSYPKRDLENSEDFLRIIDPKANDSSFYEARQIDHLWEYLMPCVEIDKVARTFVLLSLPGKKLVREKS